MLSRCNQKQRLGKGSGANALDQPNLPSSPLNPPNPLNPLPLQLSHSQSKISKKSVSDHCGQKMAENHPTQLSRDILRLAMEGNIEIVDADQNQSSNQQENAEAMETIVFFENELGILHKNNPEAILAPPTQNPNSVKPEDAKVHGANWANFFDDQVPTTSTDQTNSIPNFAENFPNNTRNFSSNTVDVSNHSVNGIGIKSVSSENPNSVKPHSSVAFKNWGSLAIEVPSTSTEEYNSKMTIGDMINSTAEELKNFINVNILVDEKLIAENEKAPADNSPQQESVPPEDTPQDAPQHVPQDVPQDTPQETSSNIPEATVEECTQEMLDPHFEPQQYVVKDEETALHTIKINQLVQVTILPNCTEYQNVLIGIYHSHPEYVAKTISGADSTQSLPNDTPFTIFVDNLDVVYKDFMIPFMKMTLKGALVNLKNGISKIPLKFHLTSSNSNNHGDVKEGKEWHLLVMPISKNRAENIRSSSQPTEFGIDECIPLSKLRIQVAKEARKNKVLKKQHRNIEVPWPLNKSNKRKRLEKEYLQIKRRKLKSMTDETLQKKITKLSAKYS